MRVTYPTLEDALSKIEDMAEGAERNAEAATTQRDRRLALARAAALRDALRIVRSVDEIERTSDEAEEETLSGEPVVHWNNGARGCTCGYKPATQRELAQHCRENRS